VTAAANSQPGRRSKKKIQCSITSNSNDSIVKHAMNAEGNGNCIIFKEFRKEQSTALAEAATQIASALLGNSIGE